VKPGWVVGLVMLFVILQIICNVCEMQAPLTSETPSHLQQLLSPDIPSYSNPIGAIASYVSVPFLWLWNFFALFFFDFSFFEGGWVYVKYVIFWPISIGMIYGLISWLRGAS